MLISEAEAILEHMELEAETLKERVEQLNEAKLYYYTRNSAVVFVTNEGHKIEKDVADFNLRKRQWENKLQELLDAEEMESLHLWLTA